MPVTTEALDMPLSRALSAPPAPPLASVPVGPPTPAVLIIAENASFRFGGEAVLPMHYFRLLRGRGVPVWMITNERNRAELSHALVPEDFARLHFIPDGRLYRWLNRIAPWLPQTLASFTIGQWIEVNDQFRARRLGRALIAKHGITVVHQPTPVSPKHVSAICDMGVPVVMGPLNGGITYPPGFRNREQWFDRVFVPLGRMLAGVVNRLLPGKLKAATVMVANKRTAAALPQAVRGRVEVVVENGVDLAVYRQHAHAILPPAAPGVTRFAFAGRLVRWKGVDLLLEATRAARRAVNLRVEILGEGPCRAALEKQAKQLGVDDIVQFRGWMSHAACAEALSQSDVLVLPSLRECGGAAVLEAMAMRLPVIATRWGGPVDYLGGDGAECGMLIEPVSPGEFVTDLAGAMVALAGDPARRRAMGEAGFARVVNEYNWDRKMERVLEVYREAVGREVNRAAVGG